MLMDRREESPELKEIVEPLTGSSVIVEQKAGQKKQLLPERPSWRDRLNRILTQADKKHLRRLLIFSGASVLTVAGMLVFFSTSGVLETDYSQTYLKLRELKPKMQGLQKDFECNRIKEHLESPYTTAQAFDKYVSECKVMSEDVGSVVRAINYTEGVQKDAELRDLYQEFKKSFNTMVRDEEKLEETLKIYKVWHSWILAESNGNIANEWDWTDGAINAATAKLTKSKYKLLKIYGSMWRKRKKVVATAYRAYYYPAGDTTEDMNETREKMLKAQNEFMKWKQENEPKVQDLATFKIVDTKQVSARFKELYDMTRQQYQKHYNREVGGCRDMAGQVVCD